jgi:hypothetical protein
MHMVRSGEIFAGGCKRVLCMHRKHIQFCRFRVVSRVSSLLRLPPRIHAVAVCVSSWLQELQNDWGDVRVYRMHQRDLLPNS